MWSVNHSNRIIEFYERAEYNVYADLKHQMGGAGQMVFAEILLGQSSLDLKNCMYFPMVIRWYL